MELYIMLAIFAVGVFLLLKLLTKPIKLALKLLFNAAIGYVMIFLLNFFGADFGITLSLSFWPAITVGILGLPGVLILLAIKYLF